MLAAQARRLGTAWTTLHLDHEAEVAELFGIPDNVRQGPVDPEDVLHRRDVQQAPREPLDTVLHLDRW